MRVVILGGGFCGSMVAKRLDCKDDLDVVLIDKEPYFEYYPSLPKLITDPEYHGKIIKRYSRFLEDVEILTEKVSKISPDHVSTTKRKVDFDILVISLGAKYPIYLDEKKNVFTVSSGKEVKELSKRMEKASDVLIVGGGLIGTEVAAEIASKTEKNVTLVHSHGRLIERNPKMASFFAESFLRSKGVRLIFDEIVVDREDDGYITSEGRVIRSDVCIWSTGLGFDKSIFHGFDDPCFTERNTLKVNDHLQLIDHPTIFVGGDIAGVDEEKTGHNADSHSRVIADNVIRFSKSLSLKSYSNVKIPLFIGLGDLNGLISFPPIGLPGPVPALVKHLLEKGALLRL
ncbi:MAG: NAD(P)/FAD-dependent oxidoreductase [Candidatus Saliniplasma sp.]